jgi:Alpha-tubulin suppressor and related RCC1 domain-containing proteins
VLSLKNQDGTACTKAVSVANDSYSRSTACIVQLDGTVWCQGSNTKGLLGTGNSTMTSSSNLVPVLTAVAGTPLAGIKKIVIGGSYYGGHACALAEDGGIWCWGRGDNGQLGTGLNVGSSFAVPVLDSAGGERLSEAIDVAAGAGVGGHTCAVKKDGSVWCWGSNTFGDLGTGSATPTSVGIPTRVAVLADAVTALSAWGTTTCAIDSKRLVWCWGTAVGPDGNYTNPSPVRLVVAKNGAAVTDVVQVDANQKRVRKSDGSIWYWDNSAAAATQPLTENGTAVSGAYWLGENCWIGADGALRASGLTNPTCP